MLKKNDNTFIKAMFYALLVALIILLIIMSKDHNKKKAVKKEKFFVMKDSTANFKFIFIVTERTKAQKKGEKWHYTNGRKTNGNSLKQDLKRPATRKNLIRS